MPSPSILPALIAKNESTLLAEWSRELATSLKSSADSHLKEECAQFLALFRKALDSGDMDATSSAFESVRGMLETLSRSRGLAGKSPTETATFIMSLKKPVFTLLRKELAGNPEAFGDEIWRLTSLLDRLALFTTEVHQKAREEVIIRQQQEMLELSTPVVTLWKGILALPLIGTLDSSRTQTVMEQLLQRIVETESEVAILDITGVPTVDTLTAQHLLKTVTATRLMGADCIISGVRPQIAQTIVHLGVNLGDVTTKSSLSAAFQVALQKVGATIVSKRGQGSSGPGHRS